MASARQAGEWIRRATGSKKEPVSRLQSRLLAGLGRLRQVKLEPATLYRLLAGNAKLKLRNLPDILHALGLAEQ